MRERERERTYMTVNCFLFLLMNDRQAFLPMLHTKLLAIYTRDLRSPLGP